MKSKLTIILAFLAFNLFSQDVETFKAKGFYKVTYKEDTNKEISEQTIGKNVVIVHDKFFKSWKISFFNEDGEKETLKLKYIQGNDETEFYTDENKNGWFIINEIKTHKRFTLALDTPPKDGVFSNYIIRDLVLASPSK